MLVGERCGEGIAVVMGELDRGGMARQAVLRDRAAFRWCGVLVV